MTKVNGSSDAEAHNGVPFWSNKVKSNPYFLQKKAKFSKKRPTKVEVMASKLIYSL